MNIQKYYDADGNPTHQVCRVLLSFQNTEKPWMERVYNAARNTIMVVHGSEVHFRSGTLKKDEYSNAVVWVMIPAHRANVDIVSYVTDFANRLGLDGIVATASFYSIDFLTSRNAK